MGIDSVDLSSAIGEGGMKIKLPRFEARRETINAKLVRFMSTRAYDSGVRLPYEEGFLDGMDAGKRLTLRDLRETEVL